MRKARGESKEHLEGQGGTLTFAGGKAPKCGQSSPHRKPMTRKAKHIKGKGQKEIKRLPIEPKRKTRKRRADSQRAPQVQRGGKWREA